MGTTNEARIEAMLIAILLDIKMHRPEMEVDALSLKLFVMGKNYDASDPHRAAVGDELRVISRFLAGESD